MVGTARYGHGNVRYGKAPYSQQSTESFAMHEEKLRRLADRCGYRLEKSHRRDPHAADFGLYALIDADTGFPVNPASPISYYSWSREQVEDFLTS
jgi:hypothetical protein